MNYKRLLKTIMVFIVYFAYNKIISSLLGLFNIDYSIIYAFLSDLLFLLSIILIYYNNLKESFNILKKEFKLKKIIKSVVLWTFLILVTNIFMGYISELLFPNFTIDSNTSAMDELFNKYLVYSIFKAMIFAVIAEELLFRESINDVIKNKCLFIIISSFIYTMTNFVYTNITTSYIGISLLVYFIPSIILSLAYIRNKNNIIILMLIKFTYNLIPTILKFLLF